MKHLGDPPRKWADNIKMYLEETECEGVDWIHLAHYWVQCLVLRLR